MHPWELEAVLQMLSARRRFRFRCRVGCRGGQCSPREILGWLFFLKLGWPSTWQIFCLTFALSDNWVCEPFFAFILYLNPFKECLTLLFYFRFGWLNRNDSYGTQQKNAISTEKITGIALKILLGSEFSWEEYYKKII